MRHSVPRALLAASALTLAFALAACGSSVASLPVASTPASAPPAASAPAGGGDEATAVAIKGFAFAPATLTVPAGTTVTWTNLDAAGHTATADDGSFDSKRLDTGATFSETFPTVGTYTYHCAIHSSMTATIVVQ